MYFIVFSSFVSCDDKPAAQREASATGNGESFAKNTPATHFETAKLLCLDRKIQKALFDGVQ
jgi:hypothetical protein